MMRKLALLTFVLMCYVFVNDPAHVFAPLNAHGTVPTFAPSAHLDTSQIDDLRPQSTCMEYVNVYDEDTHDVISTELRSCQDTDPHDVLITNVSVKGA